MVEKKTLGITLCGEKNFLLPVFEEGLSFLNIEYRKNIFHIDAMEDSDKAKYLMNKMLNVNTVICFFGNDEYFLLNKRQSTHKSLSILKKTIAFFEKNEVKRLVFPSFLGVDKNKESLYLAEKIILNSSIKEKIILRLPLIERMFEDSGLVSKEIKRIRSHSFLISEALWRSPFAFISRKSFSISINDILTQAMTSSALVFSFEEKEEISLAECLGLIVDKRVRIKSTKDSFINRALFSIFLISKFFLSGFQRSKFENFLKLGSLNIKSHKKRNSKNFQKEDSVQMLLT